MRIDGARAADRATELVLDYYAAFNRGDHPALLALLADDVVHDINQGEREIGRAAFATFLQAMSASYREHIGDVVVMATQDGRRAAAEYVVTGEYLETAEGLPTASGQNYCLPGGAFFSIRDGRIARVSNHYNLADWTRQVERPHAGL
jgi:steroid delta-isomerase-like uncharacterized protein